MFLVLKVDSVTGTITEPNKTCLFAVKQIATVYKMIEMY